ncbi:MAG: hypothetical protein JXB23_12270 [Candidatus Aminicenantes bacterium]|nr:hypothetical protein [Candidatus Aminicenantes bacterium]
MTDQRFYPKKIYVTKDSLGHSLTHRILTKLAHIPAETVSDSLSVLEELKLKKDPLGEGKKILLITEQKGGFVKPCPCTSHYLGCNYFIVNTELNCPLDCTYCILQLYLSESLITVHSNTEELWDQLDHFLETNRHRALRLGSGELGDSLALDHITERSKDFLTYFRDRSRNHAFFELKTKTVNIDNILESPLAENVIIAWSLNSEKMARQEEKGAPPIRERLAAAYAVAKRGFKVAFHFDPIIRYPGWEDGYAEVIDALFTKIDQDQVAWISLGSLRYPPHLKDIIRKRFPETRITDEELVRGRDGKLRYFKPLRLQMYRTIAGRIRHITKDRVRLYFCMESGEIWRKVLGKKPKGKEEIEYDLSLPFGYVR